MRVTAIDHRSDVIDGHVIEIVVIVDNITPETIKSLVNLQMNVIESFVVENKHKTNIH